MKFYTLSLVPHVEVPSFDSLDFLLAVLKLFLVFLPTLCVNLHSQVGCFPSKAIIRCARAVHEVSSCGLYMYAASINTMPISQILFALNETLEKPAGLIFFLTMF